MPDPKSTCDHFNGKRFPKSRQKKFVRRVRAEKVLGLLDTCAIYTFPLLQCGPKCRDYRNTPIKPGVVYEDLELMP